MKIEGFIIGVFLRLFLLSIFWGNGLVICTAQPVERVIPAFYQEIMQYNLKYSFFNVGEAYIEFRTNENCDGAWLNAEAKSSGLLKFIKDVHYKFESCMDTLTGLPSVASRIIREDEYENLNEVKYFHDLRADSALIYSIETDSVVVPKDILDILSGFYHFRANNIMDIMQDGHVDTLTTYFIDEVWDLIIRYAGEETIETKFGPVKCYKYMPVTQVGRYFKTEDDLIIWVATTGKHIPIKLKVELKLGAFTAELEHYYSPEVSLP